MTRSPRSTSGFTLIEVLVVLVLIGIGMLQLGLLVRMRGQSDTREAADVTIDDQARRALDQMAYAIIGAGRERLLPDPESPLDSSELRFEVCLGVEDGEVVWSDPQWIGLADGERKLTWRLRPGAEDERRVTWCNVVRPLLEGELINGIDDNDNGLVDEKGLSFTLEGSRVTIRLTLERTDGDGNPIQRTVESVVTVRN